MKPTSLPVQLANIPLELRKVPRWVMWSFVEVGDGDNKRWAKMPLQITGRSASSTNPPAPIAGRRSGLRLSRQALLATWATARRRSLTASAASTAPSAITSSRHPRIEAGSVLLPTPPGLKPARRGLITGARRAARRLADGRRGVCRHANEASPRAPRLTT